MSSKLPPNKPLHRIAARWRFWMNVNGDGWAVAAEAGALLRHEVVSCTAGRGKEAGIQS